MSSLLKYIPKKFHEAIRDAYHDDDGYWICLKEGWVDGIMGTHVIHTNTVAELREEARLIEKKGDNEAEVYESIRFLSM